MNDFVILPFLHQDEVEPDHQDAKESYCYPDFQQHGYLRRSLGVVFLVQVVQKLFDVRVVICTQHSYPCGEVIKPKRENRVDKQEGKQQ